MSGAPWLVVIDMQVAFEAPTSGWAVEGYAEAVPAVEKLMAAHAGHTVLTRFVRGPEETGNWSAYYDRWPEYRVASGDPVWELTVQPPGGAPVVDEPTFSKWTPRLREVVGDAPLLLCGVATECCVLATALAAADTGQRVHVVADACAGATRVMHQHALGIIDSMSPLLSVTTSDRLPAVTS